MAELTEPQKKAIVLALAHFSTPATVVAMMKSEFDVDTDVRQVVVYDPTRTSFAASDHWRELFEITRDQYIKDNLSVPIAGQGFRLRSLQEMHDKARASGNFVLAAQLLEQAAKEVGGLLTNSRNVNVSERKTAVEELTPEERRERVVDLIREALEKRAQEAKPVSGQVIENQPQKEGEP